MSRSSAERVSGSGLEDHLEYMAWPIVDSIIEYKVGFVIQEI